MGRGRAKAKQTKVARELKYREFNTDFTELQRELHGDPSDSSVDDAGVSGGKLDDSSPGYGETRSAAQR